ncbi:hypothetical protein EDI_079870 [Entamoeba dispar SAW760]|uniref:Uncharacterized protein n=1 Tax=Entamoeba dispar (strain ATCC PRA-260 / SAW760) TaxID=370354 RepID=B0EP70_ENTDS|nr:uncharacterized protein EDI_079870 [Entamoeba dispar SAW760]XP_001740947.1 uncharacterized protein EDI_241150 [Entamoeba dispar SAW760]EDR22616.1 hypothetical protein EDI_241150 [Entamoeba dispar SAW760]EDR23676.1 hypothetical protein EDI_079870 [Entamoeba dispar SAW760]|eukprot:EDR22616.1 hypothetical protein EDI_241150 [Entamoeba dispar SAW760]
MSKKINKTYLSHIKTLNNESLLEGTIIYFLSNYYSIIVTRPSKKSTMTVPFIRIKRIERNGESLDIPKFIKRRGKEYFEIHKNKRAIVKTIRRRERSRRRMETMHLLEDFLFNEGIYVNVENESVNGIGPNSWIYQSREKKVINSTEIREIGMKVISYITNELTTKNQVIIERNTILSMLN